MTKGILSVRGLSWGGILSEGDIMLEELGERGKCCYYS